MIINHSIPLPEPFLSVRSREKDGVVILSELKKKSFLPLFLPNQTPSDSYFISNRQCKGEVKTNLRGQTKYLQDCGWFMYLFHVLPLFFRYPAGSEVKASSVQLFSLYSLNTGQSLAPDEAGKYDLDSFWLLDSTITVFRGFSSTHRCLFHSMFILREEINIMFENVKLDYSIMCICHIPPWEVCSTSNYFFQNPPHSALFWGFRTEK